MNSHTFASLRLLNSGAASPLHFLFAISVKHLLNYVYLIPEIRSIHLNILVSKSEQMCV